MTMTSDEAVKTLGWHTQASDAHAMAEIRKRAIKSNQRSRQNETETAAKQYFPSRARTTAAQVTRELN